MKILCIYLKEDYKAIKQGLYKFDDEFEINFDYDNKKINIKKNDKYYHQFNDNIENISCIVGKNGMGKTTFFEILIGLKLWRIDGKEHAGKIIALYCDEEKKFYIQSYLDNATGWKVNEDYKKINKYIISKGSKKVEISNIDKERYSVLPEPISFIFHSLSPFDRIYELIKNIYLEKGDKEKHINDFGYIGTRKIKDDEPSYEFMTIKNLLYYSYTSEDFRKMLSNIGYEFKELSIKINEKFFNKNIEFVDFEDINLQNFGIKDFSEDVYNDIKTMVDEIITNKKNTIKGVLLYNLDLSKMQNLKRFVKLAIELYHQNNILDSIKNLLENIDNEKVLSTKQIFIKTNYYLLKELVAKQKQFSDSYDYLLKLKDIFKNNDTKSKKDNFVELFEALEDMKFLESHNIIDLQIILEKHNIDDKSNKSNNLEVDFLRLSSGEKTILSYFFNIFGKIHDLRDKKYYLIDKYKKLYFIILIDEVELHLHPEWQRKFISGINKFFNLMSDVKLQFIIATHSPIILSDILKKNTIYLSGDTKTNNNTFGGNIFDIYKNNFFLDDTIGEFSKKFIEELALFLNILKEYYYAKNGDMFLLKRRFIEKNVEFKYDKHYIASAEKIIYKTKDCDKYPKNKHPLLWNYLYRFREKNNELFDELENKINNIGEDIIRNYLLKTLDYVKRCSNDKK